MSARYSKAVQLALMSVLVGWVQRHGLDLDEGIIVAKSRDRHLLDLCLPRRCQLDGFHRARHFGGRKMAEACNRERSVVINDGEEYWTLVGL